MATKPIDFKPKTKFGPKHRWPGASRCQGWRSKLGRQCKKLARKNKPTCRTCGSGGRPPIHGKYSNLSLFTERVERALLDPRLLSLKPEIAILTQRADDLLGQVLDGEPIAEPAETRRLTNKILAAIRFGDQDRARQACGDLLDAVEKQKAEVDTWREIRGTFRDVDKLTRTEAATDLMAETMIPWVEVLKYIEVFSLEMFRYLPRESDRGEFLTRLRARIQVPPRVTKQYTAAQLTEPRD